MNPQKAFWLSMFIIAILFLAAGCGVNSSSGSQATSSADVNEPAESAESAESSGELPTADQVLGRADQNKDGKVTRDEFNGPAAWFDTYDKNKDGVIDEKEFPAEGTPLPKLPPPSAESIMERYDTNKDGKITSEEYTAGRGMASFFDNFDQNKDGVLTVEEIREGMSQRKKPLPKTADSADSADSAE